MRAFAAFLVLSMNLAAQEIRTVPVATGIGAPTDIQNAGDGSVASSSCSRMARSASTRTAHCSRRRSSTSAAGLIPIASAAYSVSRSLPGFAQSQRFYVDYTDVNGDTIIAHVSRQSQRRCRRPGERDGAAENPAAFCESQRRPGPLRSRRLSVHRDGRWRIGAATRSATGRTSTRCWASCCASTWRARPGKYAIPRDNPFVTRPARAARSGRTVCAIRGVFPSTASRSDLWIARRGAGHL